MLIQEKIKILLETAVKTLLIDTHDSLQIPVSLERTRDSQHGDFASNIAFQLAKPLRLAPKMIAEKIVKILEKPKEIEKIEVAGNGFINFYLSPHAQYAVIHEILKLREKFAHLPANHEKLHIEIVSANPTGPLHVGHGRLAAYCDSMANILETRGYSVLREYYLNDAGRQMNILATSVWLRYLELCNQIIVLPEAAYQGEYITDIAREIKAKQGDKFNQKISFPEKMADPDAEMDAWITLAKQTLNENFKIFFDAGIQSILTDIKQDLEEFDVKVDQYFSESSLNEKAVPECLDYLKKQDLLYQKDGATWFKSMQFGDDKDRVLIRENRELTYFASDIAYHWNKYQRGYEHILNVYGADHHGYVARIRAFVTAIGKKVNQLHTALIQLVALYRGEVKIPMSTRKGQFITLRQLREEVGKDAARYFYIMRRIEQPLDFDLELAKSKKQENPVYYIQYAYARICSVLKQHQEKFGELNLQVPDLSLLNETSEAELIRQLNRFDDSLKNSAEQLDPVVLVQYLYELASLLHRYYNSTTFLVKEKNLRFARLALIIATKEILANGLGLIGVAHPEMM